MSQFENVSVVKKANVYGSASVIPSSLLMARENRGCHPALVTDLQYRGAGVMEGVGGSVPGQAEGRD